LTFGESVKCVRAGGPVADFFFLSCIETFWQRTEAILGSWLCPIESASISVRRRFQFGFEFRRPML
jgi:hypothetical protein